MQLCTMTLEFEKLTDDLRQMAQTAARHQQQRETQLVTVLQALDDYATDWAAIDHALTQGRQKGDEKHYSTARPLTQNEPLNAQIDPPVPPSQATIIATDGSQIMPDRHAAFLYYLINIGVIVYHHGQASTPEPFTRPEIHYLAEDQFEDQFAQSSGQVSIQRDLAEIGTLARATWERRTQVAAPLLALLDQRLLYWPIGSSGAAAQKTVERWCQAMTDIRRCGALLAGYIDRPGKSLVITLLQALTADPDFDWKSLGKAGSTQGINDAFLFSQRLAPGQRSCLFLDVSRANERFAEIDPQNQTCFFYLNPGQTGQAIARIDIPLWVAEQPVAVAQVHALVYDQCQILGDYPYALARADEMAVVGKQDQANLDMMIERHMQREGIEGNITAKLGSKNLARGGRTRHEGV
jgi:hypothetical protein